VLPPALVLFDIDGTLIRRAGPHHRQVLEDAVRLVTGLAATTDGIPVQGMLDGDILAQMLRRCGLPSPAIRSSLPQIFTRAQRLYVKRCPDLRRYVCPGVRSLLHRLSRRQTVMGLVTGNLSRIGWRKMEQAGLRRHFRFGAFAESAQTRAQLAKLAVAEARRAGWIESSSPIVLIGDHPNDILAARANGLRSIAVGTGLADVEELRTYQPDLVVPDMRSLSVESIVC